MTPTPRFFAALITLAALIAAPVAFAGDDQAGRYYEDARTRLAKGDAAGAIIQLRNALQESPKFVAAQALLGQAYVRDQKPELAQEALERALVLGIDKSEVALPLAEALLAQGKADVVLERLPAELLQGNAKAELLMFRGQARKQLGDLASAAQSLEQGRALNPNAVEVLLSLAEVQALRGLRQDSLKYADKALELAARNPRAWYVKGMVQQIANDVPGAIQAFGKALEIAPRYIDARVARVALSMSGRPGPTVKADIDYLLAEHPNEPRGNYLRAVYLGLRGDNEGARAAMAAAAKVLAPIPAEVLKRRNPELLMLAGVVFHGLDEPERARAYLEAVLALNPNDVAALKLLGSIYLRKQDYASAIKTLEPAEHLAPKDANLLLLLGQAYLGRGRSPMAAHMLERAFRAGADLPNAQAAYGLTLLRKGNRDEGAQQLRAAFEKDPGQPQAGMALAVMHLNAKEFKQAVAIMERVVQRDPENPAYLNLLGIVRQAASDIKGSRAAFEHALRVSPSLVSAALNLAKLDMAEGRMEAARARMEALLKADPKSVQTMLELARLESAQGRTAAAIGWLEKAYAVEPNFLPVAFALVNARLAARDGAKALTVIKDLESNYPEDLDVLAASVRARLAAGDAVGAQSVLGKMTRLAQYDPARQNEVARLQLAAGNFSGATYSLEKALADRPDYLPAQATYIDIDLAKGQPDAAEKRARAIIAAYPQRAIGYRALGNVLVSTGRLQDAVTQFKAAFSKEATTENVLLLHLAQARAGNLQAAVGTLEQWVARKPSDLLALRALSEGYIRLRNYPAARARLEAGLKLRPEDPGFLNNMATVTALAGDRAKALTYAEKCVRIVPEDAGARDTLGWLLVQTGSTESGLKHLREARVRAPRNPEIRYHLAAALYKAGRAAEAKEELKDFVSSADDFPEAAEAAALGRTLGLL